MKQKILAGLLSSVSILGLGVSVGQKDVSAHGYVESPPSRGYYGHMEKNTIGWTAAIEKYGKVVDDPFSLEEKKGFPEKGPLDNQLASVNEKFDGVLDDTGANRWNKTDVNQGKTSIRWFYTAPHETTQWRYYMTKQGWNPNEKLKRSDLELITTVPFTGETADKLLTHTVDIPKDRLGYHVIYAVWDVDNTANAFYNVIDVNVKEDSNVPEVPLAPQSVKVDNVTDRSVKLSWAGQTNIATYNVYRNGIKVGSTANTEFEDTQLTPETEYEYTVEAVSNNGLASPKSSPVIATTSKTEDEQEKAPTAPMHLHSMGETQDTVALMWGKSTHATGIKEYQIFRDGAVIATTSKTNYTDENLTENTEYSYTVKAVSNSGLVSEHSNKLSVRTASSNPEGRVWKVGTFSAPELYTAGEEVVHQGKVYTVIQTHNNYGDTTWAPDQAVTLFNLK